MKTPYRIAKELGADIAFLYRIKRGEVKCPPLMALDIEWITQGEWGLEKLHPELAQKLARRQAILSPHPLASPPKSHQGPDADTPP